MFVKVAENVYEYKLGEAGCLFAPVFWAPSSGMPSILDKAFKEDL